MFIFIKDIFVSVRKGVEDWVNLLEGRVGWGVTTTRESASTTTAAAGGERSEEEQLPLSSKNKQVATAASY